MLSRVLWGGKLLFLELFMALVVASLLAVFRGSEAVEIDGSSFRRFDFVTDQYVQEVSMLVPAEQAIANGTTSNQQLYVPVTDTRQLGILMSLAVGGKYQLECAVSARAKGNSASPRYRVLNALPYEDEVAA